MRSGIVKVLAFSLLLNAMIAVADFVAAPLHRTGVGQGVLGFFIGFAYLLRLPGLTLFPGSHVLECAFNLSFWAVVGLIWSRVGKPLDDYEVDSSRRQALLRGGRTVAGIGMGLGSWGLFAEPRWFEVTRREIGIKGLPFELDRLRIVQLSDIHHGPWMSIAWVRQIVEVTNSLMPDVVALTGDYVYRGLQYVKPVARELKRLEARVGVVGVMGNHDWSDGGGPVTKRAFAEEGLKLIDNARIFVTPARRITSEAREGLCIAGVGDLWEDKCHYARALGNVPGGMPRMLLSHNPDVAEHPEFLQSGYRVDLMLSGHTHGGQVWLPGVGSPVTNSAFGQKYVKGLVEGPACPVFVSRGLGMTAMPIRIGVRPEIAVIDLRRA